MSYDENDDEAMYEDYDEDSDGALYENFDEDSYEATYLSKLGELAWDMPKDEIDEFDQELFANHNRRHSENPAADAELNFMRVKKIIDGRNQLDSASEGFVRYMAMDEGRPEAEVRREAQRFLRKGSPQKKKVSPDSVKFNEDELRGIKGMGMSEKDAREFIASNEGDDIPNIKEPF